MKIHTYADLLMFSSRVIWSVTEMNKSSEKKTKLKASVNLNKN